MDEATCASTRTTMIHVVSAQDLVGRPGASHLREGFLLKLMDLCTCASAEQLSGQSSVTLAVDDLLFSDTRLRAGETVQVSAQVNCAWGTSMECGCTVVVDNEGGGDGGDVRHVCRAFFTFVSLGRDGKKIRLPKLVADGVDNLRRMALANERRKIRFRRKSIIAHAAETLSLRVRTSGLGATKGDHSEATKGDKEVKKAAATATAATAASIDVDVPHQPIAAPLLKTTEIVLPQHANHHGNTFGGQIMAWMSTAARVVAFRHVAASVSADSTSTLASAAASNSSSRSRSPMPIVVAQSIDDIFFVAPSLVGDRVTIQSRVTRTFAQTLEVQCEVYAHAIGKEKRLINRAVWVFTTTAVGMHGDGDHGSDSQEELTPLVQVDPDHSAEAREAFEQALGRRALRIKRNALGSGHNLDPSWEWDVGSEGRKEEGKDVAKRDESDEQQQQQQQQQHATTSHVEFTAKNVSSLLTAFWHKGSTAQSAWGLLEAASTQATKLYMREDKDLIHVRAVSRLVFSTMPYAAATVATSATAAEAAGATVAETESKRSTSMFGFGMFRKRRPSAVKGGGVTSAVAAAPTENGPLARVFSVLCDNKQRTQWDVLCERCETVRTLDEHNDITRLVFKKPTTVDGEVALSDFALLRSWRANDDRSRFLIANHSIRAPQIVPEVEGCVRGAVGSAGWVLEAVAAEENDDGTPCDEVVVELTYLVTLAAAGIQALGATAVDVLAGRSKVICHNIAGIAKVVGATLRGEP
jgi:acyl-CoA hydrolase